jgi:hypothetical protein
MDGFVPFSGCAREGGEKDQGCHREQDRLSM